MGMRMTLNFICLSVLSHPLFKIKLSKLLVHHRSSRLGGSHNLIFNDTKTEFLMIGTRQQLSKVTMDSFEVVDADVKLVQKV